MNAYAERLRSVPGTTPVAGFRSEAGAVLAVGGPVRTLRGWSDLAVPGPWLVCLPYAFPAVPGRAWDASRAQRWPADALAGRSGVDAPRGLGISAAWDGDGHAERVRSAQRAIADGLFYQLNLACRWDVALAPSPQPETGLHLALLDADPARFAAIFRGGDGPAVVGNSPELFLHIAAGRIRSQPIKGTRVRRPGHEAETRSELAASAKERAELAMIVDLVRNDLGRVAEPGSVVVSDPGSVIDLPRLHHRVATVEARLRPGTGVADAIAAAFPAGSITGAPKRSAMAHIARLEGFDRGAWCGAYGLVEDGGCTLAVAIRSVEIDGSALALRAGGGIVADSDPDAEWHEARAKARGIANALGVEP